MAPTPHEHVPHSAGPHGSPERPTCRLNRRGAERWRASQPWFSREELIGADPVGDVVRVLDERGAVLGTGLFAPTARVPLRRWSAPLRQKHC